MLSAAISEGPDEEAAHAINRTESWFALATRPRHEKSRRGSVEWRRAGNVLALGPASPPVWPQIPGIWRPFVPRLSVLPLQCFTPTSCDHDSRHRWSRLRSYARKRCRAYVSPERHARANSCASASFPARRSRVAITEGPLAGLEGIVVKEKDPLRMVVSVGLLQRSVLLEIAADRVGAPRLSSDLNCYDYR